MSRVEQKMMASEDPLGDVLHVLSGVTVTNLNASDVEKTNRLLDGLSRAFKAYFVWDTPQTAHPFSERLKSLAVEHAYKQGAGTGLDNLASLPGSASFGTATASALALQQLLQSSTGAPFTPVYANLTGNVLPLS